MKKIFLILTICLISLYAKTQVVFNKIITDTIGNITSSVIVVDTGYIFLTGTGNQFGNRSFSLRYVDLEGESAIKRIFGDAINEHWEGLNNSLKIQDDSLYMAGCVINPTNSYFGVMFYILDGFLNQIIFKTLNSDPIWKKGFNVIRIENCFYLVGMRYYSDIDEGYLYVIKTDRFGEIIWEKSYGQEYETGEQIIETSDNHILIGGLTFSFPTTVTDEDWYLIKLDTAGNVIWQNGFGRPGFLNYDGPVKGLIETRDSNYVACGKYPALRSDTDTYWDGCLRKVSTDGVLMWERFYRSYSSISNPVTDWFENSISSVLYKNDDIFVIGNWRSRIGRSRGYLQKITENGDICWNREYYAIDYTTNDQYFVSFQPTADNGFILAGYGNNYNSYGYNPAQQAWLVKTDSLGIDGLCYNEPPELNIDVVLPATVNCSDTITVYAYIAGKSAPYTVETSIGQVIDSIYYPPLFVPVEIGLSLAEIDYGGNIIYSQQITEATLSNHEWGQCIAKPIEFYTPHTSGSQEITITVTDAYGESKTITKEVFVNECGSGISSEAVNSINVYPNPAVDNLHLDLDDTVFPVNCEIYNSLGQLVKTMQLSNDLTVINVKDFASGVYQIKIIDGDGNVIVKSFEKQ
jgi:hypothetical protein